MKNKNLLIEVNKIKNKLDSTGYEINKVVISDETGEITTHSLEAEKLTHLENINEDIQAQIDNKASIDGYAENKLLITDENGNISTSNIDKEKIEVLETAKEDIDILKSTATDYEDFKDTTINETAIIKGDINNLKEKDTYIENELSRIEDKIPTVDDSGQIDLSMFLNKETGGVIKGDISFEKEGNKVIEITDTIHINKNGELKEVITEEIAEDYYSKNGGVISGDVIIEKNEPSLSLKENETEKAEVKFNNNELSTAINDEIKNRQTIEGFYHETPLFVKNSDGNGYFQVSKNIKNTVCVDTEKYGFTDIAIQNAIDEIQSSGGTVYVPNGTYTMDNTILLYSDIKVIGLGEVEFIKNSITTEKVMLMGYISPTAGEYTGIKDVAIENIIFNGNNETSNYGLVTFGHATNIQIKDCSFINLTNQWNMIEFNAVYNGVIENCIFKNYSGTEAIQLDLMASGAYPISNVLIDDTHCRNIFIKNCNFIDVNNKAIGNHIYKDNCYLKDIYIENNSFINSNETCIMLSDVKNYHIKNNLFENCATAIRIDTTPNISSKIFIEGNDFVGTYKGMLSSSGNGRFFQTPTTIQVEKLKISNNTITKCRTHAIGLTCNEGTFTANTITLCGQAGIYIYGGFVNIITNNILKGNDVDKTGIRGDITLGGNSSVVASYSTVSNNYIDYLHSTSYVNASLVIGNSIYKNINYVTTGSNAFRNNWIGGSYYDTGTGGSAMVLPIEEGALVE